MDAGGPLVRTLALTRVLALEPKSAGQVRSFQSISTLLTAAAGVLPGSRAVKQAGRGDASSAVHPECRGGPAGGRPRRTCARTPILEHQARRSQADGTPFPRNLFASVQHLQPDPSPLGFLYQPSSVSATNSRRSLELSVVKIRARGPLPAKRERRTRRLSSPQAQEPKGTPPHTD